MKKKYISLITMLVVLILLVLMGCSLNNGSEVDPIEDTPFDALWAEAPEGTIAVLVNFPSESQLSNFTVSERLVLQQTEERFLLIPAESVDSIIIWAMEFNGTDHVRTGSVYENHTIGDNFVLDLIVMRPEGGPHFQLSINGEAGKADYYITYDGKDGTPNIEYIIIK